MIKTLAHLCILSTDLNRTLDFYCGTLGLRKKFDFIRNGALFGFYLEVDANHFIEVFKAQNGLPENVLNQQITHFCLEVADIDVLRETLTAKGIKVTEKKLGADQSWQAWCKDPDGIDIEFHQYTPRSTQLTGEKCVVDW